MSEFIYSVKFREINYELIFCKRVFNDDRKIYSGIIDVSAVYNWGRAYVLARYIKSNSICWNLDDDFLFDKDFIDHFDKLIHKLLKNQAFL